MIPETQLLNLSVLNVSAGDVNLQFDPADEADKAKAEKVITSMLRRGYMLFARLPDGKLQRIYAFDPQTCSYVIEEPAEHEYPVPSPLTLQGATTGRFSSEQPNLSAGSPQAAAGEPAPAAAVAPDSEPPAAAAETPPADAPARRRGRPRKQIPAAGQPVDVVPRSAGG